MIFSDRYRGSAWGLFKLWQTIILRYRAPGNVMSAECQTAVLAVNTQPLHRSIRPAMTLLQGCQVEPGSLNDCWALDALDLASRETKQLRLGTINIQCKANHRHIKCTVAMSVAATHTHTQTRAAHWAALSCRPQR